MSTHSSTPGARLALWQAWLVIAAVTLVCGVGTLIFPFGRDQLYYAFLGDCLLHGKVFYRDIPMMQMPLTGVVHALALLLFGRSMAAIRILDLLWTLATAGFIFLLVRRAFRRDWLALAAGCLYPVLYSAYDWWYSTQVDGFLNLPLAIAGWLAVRAAVDENPRPIRFDWLLAGALVGLALFFKYSVLLFLPAVAFALLGRSRWRTPTGRRAVLNLTAGCLLVVALAFAWLAISGGLSGFFSTQIGLVLPYSQEGQPETSLLPRLLRMFQSYLRPAEYQLGGWLALLGAVVGLGALRTAGPETRRGVVLALLWLVAALGSVFFQGKLMFYHYLPLLPPVAILGALALAVIFRGPATAITRTGYRLLVLSVLLVGMVLVTPIYDRLADLVQVAGGEVKLSEFWNRRFAKGDFVVAEYRALADYIRDHTVPKDRVTNFGIDPGITFPAWREPLVKYTSTFSLDPSTWTLPTEFAADPPEVFIVKHEDRIPWVRGNDADSYEQLLSFAQLRDFVTENYELETRVGHFDILRRANSERQPPPAAARAGESFSRDLDEALQFAAANPGAKTVIWPVAVPPGGAVAPELRSVLPRLVSQRRVNRALWLQEAEMSDLLPALSVWTTGDDRPFAHQEPFSFQNDGTNFITTDFRFTKVHGCRNGLVTIYRIDAKTGEEAVRTR